MYMMCVFVRTYMSPYQSPANTILKKYAYEHVHITWYTYPYQLF